MADISEAMVEAAQDAALREGAFLGEDMVRYMLEAALSAASAQMEGWRPTHRHKKRGSTYQIIAEGRLQVDADLDNEKVVVYRGEDGQVWVRPTYEFNDGRFEALRESLPTAGGEKQP